MAIYIVVREPIREPRFPEPLLIREPRFPEPLLIREPRFPHIQLYRRSAARGRNP